MKKQKRHLTREGLEVYPLNLLLLYRPALMAAAVLFLMCAMSVYQLSSLMGSIILAFGVLLLLPASFFQAAVYLAKTAAWLGTLYIKRRRI